MSKHIVSFDDGFFDVLSEELADLSSEIRKKIFRHIREEIYFFYCWKEDSKLSVWYFTIQVYNHLLFAIESVIVLVNPNFAQTYFIDYDFKIKKSSLGNNSVKELMDQVKIENFIPFIYHVITDFIRDDRK